MSQEMKNYFTEHHEYSIPEKFWKKADRYMKNCPRWMGMGYAEFDDEFSEFRIK